MRVVQLLPSLVRGDAIGNDAICIDKVLKEAGYETRIFADYLGKRIDDKLASEAGDMSEITKKDLLLYHVSTGSRLNHLVTELPCRKIFIYHNITPAHYFAGCNPVMERKAREGLCEIRRMRAAADMVLAVSKYNKLHLRSMGYTCPIEVMPVLIPWEDYEAEADSGVLEKYGDDCFNILFTGRIAPNKKQEDLIAAYYEFHKNCFPKSRLILVGNDAGMEFYAEELKQYASALGLGSREVVFTGHVSFEEMIGFYKTADVFLCLSEHEGFCVPLAEAMHFSLPIVAFDAGAVGETLGGSGILLKKKEPAYVSRVLRELHANPAQRQRIVEEQNRRRKDFDKERIVGQFLSCIRGMEEGNR